MNAPLRRDLHNASALAEVDFELATPPKAVSTTVPPEGWAIVALVGLAAINALVLMFS